MITLTTDPDGGMVIQAEVTAGVTMYVPLSDDEGVALREALDGMYPKAGGVPREPTEPGWYVTPGGKAALKEGTDWKLYDEDGERVYPRLLYWDDLVRRLGDDMPLMRAVGVPSGSIVASEQDVRSCVVRAIRECAAPDLSNEEYVLDSTGRVAKRVWKMLREDRG